MTTIEQWLAWAEKLEAAATKGPWAGRGECADNRPWIEAGDRGFDEVLVPANVDCMQYCLGGSSRAEMREDDRAFIAATRNYNAAVLDVVRAAKKLCVDSDYTTLRKDYEASFVSTDDLAVLRHAVKVLAETMPKDGAQ